ncbi:hypothetical protein BFP76_11310 [Amylibacter kogurei]|uniref:DUF3131 domain-containing protein n=1 Tax=Paramylibacter kogurei TaxID=1889778 RepID=A0A2G5KBS9_9RHOB|nr:DUF3131 domain-containing protein [Amylibacter kogurei]PIB26493.1 hypothetical protein BFP76_11310 [Amylibacter kogurei]
MSTIDNIIKARSHIAFIFGLCIAAAIAYSVETGVSKTLHGSTKFALIEISDRQTVLAKPVTLNNDDLIMAKAAWRYFERNTQETGLVNAADNFPSTTIWDQASYLLGLISAHKMGVVSDAKFDARLASALTSLRELPLFDSQLPNKVYDTRYLTMTNYKNDPVARGVGWSALDVARMIVPLTFIMQNYPTHANDAFEILQQWDFSKMIDGGVLHGARVTTNNTTEIVQEGRLGYEEYAARAISLIGLDALRAAKFDDYLRFEKVSKQLIAVDSRSFAEFDAHNYVVSEPYILTALEFGFDSESQELAHRIYSAQENRYKEHGILTAVSEDNIDQEPYFLYNTVFANGVAWNTLAENGDQFQHLRTVSTKAAIGWDVLYNTTYTNALVKHVDQTRDQNIGWYSGVYENDGTVNKIATANTNAIILQAIYYKQFGPLLTQSYLKQGSS